MRKPLLTIIIVSLSVVAFSHMLGACRKDQNTRGLELWSQEIPSGFPSPIYTYADNPLSKEGFELGRKLFYEGRLSVDDQHSCASCHQQNAGFGTFEHDRSHGVNNSHTLRNAPVLFNLAWNPSFGWDGAFNSIEEISAAHINSTIDMGESFDGAVAKLQDDPQYRELFKKVFRYPFIKTEFILKALSQFIGYVVSANSKYDRVIKGTDVFTAQESNGYAIYQLNCSSCHPEPLFTDYSYRNIGLPMDAFLIDKGRLRVTGFITDSLKFKVPTLRNTYISSNYMHDGRFGTISQCINHYRSGVQQSPTLDPLLVNGIPLTNSEANDLFVFIRALTDSSLLTDPRFSKQP